MRWRWVAVVMLLAAQPAAAEALPSEVELRLVYPLFDGREPDLARYAQPTQGMGMCDDPAVTSAEPITVDQDAPINGFLFSESETENACASVAFPIDLPAWDIAGLAVSFDASRKVSSAPPGVQPDARQAIVIRGEGQDCSAILDYFLPADPTRKSTPIRFDAKADAGCLQPGQAAAVWIFEDPLRGQISVPAREAFSASVQDAHVEIFGPVDGVASQHFDGRSPDGRLIGYVAAEYTFGPIPRSGSLQATLALSNAYGIHQIQIMRAGGFQDVDPDAFEARERNGTLFVTLSSERLGLEPGTSPKARIIFTSPSTAVFHVGAMTAVAPIVVLPLVSGVLAHRAIHALRVQTTSASPARVRLIEWLAIGGWAVFTLTLFLLIISGRSALMLSWPLHGVAWASFAALTLAVVLHLVARSQANAYASALVRGELSERERMQVALERSNRELEQFAYVASHDLKEPLRMISGYTQLLERRYADVLDDKGLRFLHHASDGAKRLQGMVDALLQYSRIRPDKTHPSMVDAKAVAQRAAEALAPLLKERNAKVVIDDLPRVYMDQDQLEMVFHHLIDNGSKFNAAKRPTITIAAQIQRGTATLSVTDNGIGIRDADQEAAFDIFRRLNRRDEYPGAGIGLSLVKKIVTDSGGDVSIESTKTGTRFLLRLPTAPPSHAGP